MGARLEAPTRDSIPGSLGIGFRGSRGIRGRARSRSRSRGLAGTGARGGSRARAGRRILEGMKHPRDVSNPDVVDERGAPPPLLPYPGSENRDSSTAWDGVEPLVLKSEAHRRAMLGILVTAAAVGITGFALGRSLERDKHRAAARAARVTRRSLSSTSGRRIRR
jgi:hypothetical protein